LSASFELLTNAHENMYCHMFKKCVLLSFVYLPFRAVYNPSRDFYWHKTFHHSLLANGTHKTPSKGTYFKLRSMHNILNLPDLMIFTFRNEKSKSAAHNLNVFSSALYLISFVFSSLLARPCTYTLS